MYTSVSKDILLSRFGYAERKYGAQIFCGLTVCRRFKIEMLPVHGLTCSPAETTAMYWSNACRIYNYGTGGGFFQFRVPSFLSTRITSKTALSHPVQIFAPANSGQSRNQQGVSESARCVIHMVRVKRKGLKLTAEVKKTPQKETTIFWAENKNSLQRPSPSNSWSVLIVLLCELSECARSSAVPFFGCDYEGGTCWTHRRTFPFHFHSSSTRPQFQHTQYIRCTSTDLSSWRDAR
jgi:hypothetical protein